MSIASTLPMPGVQLPSTGASVAGPDAMSTDRQAMDAHIRDVQTVLRGSRSVIAGRQRYLPKFARETDGDYQVRLDVAKFTNVFRDLLDNLASKPFARTVDLAETSKAKWPTLASFVENVDGAGNHLHVFAGELFFNSIAYSVDWLVVDKTPVPKGVSLKVEKEAGARVYWYRVPQTSVLAVYSDVMNGEEVFTHFRYREDELVRDNWGERLVERVRVMDRQKLPGSTPQNPQYGEPYWQLYERKFDAVRNSQQAAPWEIIDSGDFGIGEIPIIPVTTGRRIGKSWQFVHTMEDVLHLQMKMYQAETNLEYAKLMTGSPMLSAKDANPPLIRRKVTVNGIEDIIEEPAPVVVGPKTVLYGEWDYVQIDANALTFLANDVQRCERQLREIGRQPLTTDSGNLTVVTTMFAAQKGNSAVQAWALGLKDCLERAFNLTGRWMTLDADCEVNVWTDFSIDLESEAAPMFLLALNERGYLSREALIAEGKRRNYLSAEYDATTDIEKVVKDLKDYEFLADRMAAGGENGSGSGSGARGGKSASARVRADVRETK